MSIGERKQHLTVNHLFLDFLEMKFERGSRLGICRLSCHCTDEASCHGSRASVGYEVSSFHCWPH